jgi:hypothetical protein
MKHFAGDVPPEGLGTVNPTFRPDANVHPGGYFQQMPANQWSKPDTQRG